MLYKDLTTEQQEYLQEASQYYGDFPEDATHIDFDAVVLKYTGGVEYHYWPYAGWEETLDTRYCASNIFEIPEDFCRETGEILYQNPSEDVSNQTDTNTQGDVENVSERLSGAFKTIQELCIDKGISLSFDSQGNVQILTAYGDYVLDTTREDLQDVISKMADVNQIVKGEF